MNPFIHAGEGDERIRTAVCAPSTDPSYDHQNDPAVAWLTVEGRTITLTESMAWEIAWALIGLCVASKQARGGAA